MENIYWSYLGENAAPCGCCSPFGTFWVHTVLNKDSLLSQLSTAVKYLLKRTEEGNLSLFSRTLEHLSSFKHINQL